MEDSCLEEIVKDKVYSVTGDVPFPQIKGHQGVVLVGKYVVPSFDTIITLCGNLWREYTEEEVDVDSYLGSKEGLTAIDKSKESLDSVLLPALLTRDPGLRKKVEEFYTFLINPAFPGDYFLQLRWGYVDPKVVSSTHRERTLRHARVQWQLEHTYAYLFDCSKETETWSFDILLQNGALPPREDLVLLLRYDTMGSRQFPVAMPTDVYAMQQVRRTVESLPEELAIARVYDLTKAVGQIYAWRVIEFMAFHPEMLTGLISSKHAERPSAEVVDLSSRRRRNDPHDPSRT